MIIKGDRFSNTLIGTPDADTISGGGGQDSISGRGGEDEINGNRAADWLRGGAGVDTVNGGLGADVIYSGADNDVLSGGLGSDTFVYRDVSDAVDAPEGQEEEILDLENRDTIDLSGVDANANVSGNQAFTIVDAFTGQAGDLIIVFEEDEDETYIRGDVNGDSQIDLQIELEGRHLGFDNLVL
jgi:Ca2+-binding RTX toxin-like protein